MKSPIDQSFPQLPSFPSSFKKASTAQLIELVGNMLGRLVLHNDRLPLNPLHLTRFHSKSVPPITIHDYLERIIRYGQVEKNCLLLILAYMDRIFERDPSFVISSLTVHRFLVTILTVASKTYSDTYLTNVTYSKVGGLSTHELALLESETLQLLDWELCGTSELLQGYYEKVLRLHTLSSPVLAAQSLMLPTCPSPPSVATNATLHKTALFHHPLSPVSPLASAPITSMGANFRKASLFDARPGKMMMTRGVDEPRNRDTHNRHRSF